MKLTIDTKCRLEPLGDLYGIFFEDLNHAADGGVYAELVQNRSYEFASVDNESFHPLVAWEKIENDGEAALIVETGNPISHKNPHYLGIDVLKAGDDVGVQNLGFNTGIPLTKDMEYYFTVYAKREQDLEEPVKISLRSKDGQIYTSGDILLTDEWEKYELNLNAPVTDYSGRLAITISGKGKVYLDFVSLFPKDTWKGRRNGLRKDIVEILAEMKPKFMRFPGGCLVHVGSLDSDTRDSQYRWKNTIGPVEERPARKNNWGYNQTLGLGYYEYFLLCEDIGAKPLPILPAGYDPHHRHAAPLHKMQPFIDDALDLIEFANGSLDTVWGRKRAELGHPEPFGLEYLGIGNEEVGAEFFERYDIIHKAVKEKYPDIKLINTSGPNAEGSEYERGWANARKNHSDYVDEHYYQSPEWFLANHHRYDSYKKEDPKVFLGEYASWGNTWYNALVEASYMVGMEKNAHAVGLACYAPMLANVDYINWKPDMIWFDNHQVYGSANYYVQKLFMKQQGKFLLKTDIEEAPEAEIQTKTADRICGEVLLGSYKSGVEYSTIKLTNEDTGEVNEFPSCNISENDKPLPLIATTCSNYTLGMKAKEVTGYQGFQFYFGSENEENQFCWTIGGWQNQDTFIAEKINNRNSDLSQNLFSVEKDREYDLELRVNGRRIRTYVDGILYHDTISRPAVVEPIYFTASEDDNEDILVKVVNVSTYDRQTEIFLKGLKLETNDMEATVYSMSGFSPDVQNDFEHPEAVVDSEYKISITGEKFQYEFPPQSITIIRIPQ